MKRLYIIALAELILLISSCSNKDHSITLTEQTGGSLMIMNMKSMKDTTRIKLSDFATDLRFIRLETLPECLISSATYYISNKYILAKTKTDIFQFDHLGKFIRILATRGQGPREFETVEWVIDEKNQRLIVADEQKLTYFLSFDLKTGEYSGDIPKAIPGVTRKFGLTEYGSLACVPYLNRGDHPDQLYLFWQDMEGKLIDEVKAPADLEIYRDNYFEPVTDGYRYMLANNNKDTIYTLLDKRLIPYLAFNHGEEFPENMEAPGYRNMKIAFETDQYLFLRKLQVTDVTISGNNTSISWAESDYLLNKNQKKASPISGIQNDFIGSKQQVQAFNIQSNGVIYIALQAMELIGDSERAIVSPKSDQKIIGRMTEIRDQIKREDNPVLVVGRVK